jgi:HKD family nuclease
MKENTVKIDLHACLKKYAFDHALIATYNFDSRFFENYALENFQSLQENNNITVFLDEGEYRGILKKSEENPEYFPKQANLRYLLHPIRVAGVFHPKVFMFTNSRRGLLLIGSANFTQDGFCSNAELVARFDYEDGKQEDTILLFQSVFRFFQQLCKRWPSDQLNSNLNTLVAGTPWISKEIPNSLSRNLPDFLHNLNTPLWDQLVSRLPGKVSKISVLSRFYDANPVMYEFAHGTTQFKKLTLYTQNRITTLTKNWLELPQFKSGQLDIKLCHYSEDDHPQQLHGKAYGFTCNNHLMLAMGSANFTTAGLRCTPQNGNLEVLLSYPAVGIKHFSIESFFDPQDTALLVRDASELQTASANEDESTTQFPELPIRIADAIVEDNCLKISLISGIITRKISCRIFQGYCLPITLKIGPYNETLLHFKLDHSVQDRLDERPALVEIGVLSNEDWLPQSYPVLIINLQDIVTGRNVRRERQIREARESPQQFMNVLTLLSNSEDEERLKQFLTSCDIQLNLESNSFPNRTKMRSPLGIYIESFKISGERSFRQFEALHDAVMGFVSRHKKRLNNHIDQATEEGIPNYIHILLTLINLLLSQISKIIYALDSDSQVKITPEQWHQARENLDAYYRTLNDLLKITSNAYLPNFFKGKLKKSIKSEFEEVLPEIRTAILHAFKNRDRLCDLQKTKLVVITQTGRSHTGPGFFKSILSPTKWPSYRISLEDIQHQIESLFSSK